MRFLFVLLSGLAGFQIGWAQDVIVLRDAREIAAEVKEIDERSVVYRNYGDSTGPLRRIGRDKIFSITYRNGEKDVFVGPDSKPDPVADYPWPSVSRAYAVGDYFAEGNVVGIVVRVTDGGRHGLLMSVLGEWLPYSDEEYSVLGYLPSDRDDGWRNLCVLEQQLRASGVSLDRYPAHAWCRSLGPGGGTCRRSGSCRACGVLRSRGRLHRVCPR